MRFALRYLLVIMAPLLLVGCVVTPGKFVSALIINADRTFTYSYKGEVYAVDTAKAVAKGLGTATGQDVAEKADTKPDPATERKRQEIAASLMKEAGYRSATYAGNGKYVIDYAIAGVLTHNFVYPYNADADVVTPFIAVELRAGGTVRVRAPGFAAPLDGAAAAQLGDQSLDMGKYLDGSFTLDTPGTIIGHNSESGSTSANGRTVIRWKSTPTTKDVPSAVIRVTQ